MLGAVLDSILDILAAELVQGGIAAGLRLGVVLAGWRWVGVLVLFVQLTAAFVLAACFELVELLLEFVAVFPASARELVGGAGGVGGVAEGFADFEKQRFLFLLGLKNH